MYKYLIAIVLLFMQMSWGFVVVWPLGLSVRMDRDEDQNLVTRVAQQYSAGININIWSIELGRTQFQSQSQEGNVQIKREYEDLTLWLGQQFTLSDKINFVGSGGLGLYQEKIKTVVGSISDSSSSEQKPLLGLAGELRWRPSDFGFLLSTGARLMMAENFDPNPQPEIFFRAGWQF